MTFSPVRVSSDRCSLAESIIFIGIPSLSAMKRALLFPGSPMISLNVGARVAGSNSIPAASTPLLPRA